MSTLDEEFDSYWRKCGFSTADDEYTGHRETYLEGASVGESRERERVLEVMRSMEHKHSLITDEVNCRFCLNWSKLQARIREADKQATGSEG